VQVTQQCKGHCFLGFAIEVNLVEVAHRDGRGCFYDGIEQSRILCSAAGDENFAHWLGDEPAVRIRDTCRGKLHRGRDDVFVRCFHRARGGDQLLHIIGVEKLTTRGLGRIHAEIRMRHQLVDDGRHRFAGAREFAIDVVRQLRP